MALGHAQEEALEPVGETAAQQQQVVVLELAEQLLRAEVLRLQHANELENVLIGNGVGGHSCHSAEQVKDGRPYQVALLARQVDELVRRVCEHVGPGFAAEAGLVDGLLEQRVERGGDVEIEIGDRSELT